MPIKAVFFDLYNTLACFDPPVEELQVDACREFGISVTPEGIARGYALADDYMARENALQPISQRSQEERRQFFGEYERLVLQGAGVDVSPETSLDIFRRTQRVPLDLALFDDVGPALEMLMMQEKTLGLITNIDPILAPVGAESIEELCSRLSLAEYLDFTITSQEVGATKPHPSIFLAALRKASVEPHEAIHVGDQYHSDVVGARAVGILPVLMDRANAHADFQECPRIQGLMELVRLVDSYD